MPDAAAPPPPPPPPAAAPVEPVPHEAPAATGAIPDAPVAAAAVARKGPSNLLIGIAAGVALLVVVGVGVGISATAISQLSSTQSTSPERTPKPTNSADEKDDEDEEPTSSPTPTATPTASEEAAPAATDPPVVFQSVSGNIICSVTKVSAVCHQNNIKYSPPSSACATALGGATVGVDRRSVYWPCLDTAMQGATNLAYDVPVVAYDFTCSINYVSGVTCYNEGGSGFTMEYTNGIYTF